MFAGTLATRIVLLRPKDPESKGMVERRNGWFETSFMPGRHFASPADFNDQFTDWLATANARVVRTLKARPTDLLAADRAAMLPLPPVRRCTWGGATRSGWAATTTCASTPTTTPSTRRAIGPDGRRGRRPGRPGPARRAAGRRAPARLGPRHDGHRPRPRRRPPPRLRHASGTRAPSRGRRTGPRPGRLRPRLRVIDPTTRTGVS